MISPHLKHHVMQKRLHKKRRRQPLRRLLLQHLQLLLRLVQVTIHFQLVAQFRVHLVQATIHFLQVAQFHVHHKDHRVQALHDQVHHVLE